MELIYPLPLALSYTGSSPTYVYVAWATSTAYAVNDIRRYQVNSEWRDYRCLRSHVSTSYWFPTNPYYWADLGPASTTGGYTYLTNVRLSNASTWTSGAAVNAGAAVFDSADNRDYQSTIAISAGDNTIRPSEAIRSSTAAVAARWICIGAANAWAPFDHIINSYLHGIDTNGAQVSPAFTVTTSQRSGYIDRVAFDGLHWVSGVTVEVWLDNTKTETVSHSLLAPSGILSAPGHACVIPLTAISAWLYTDIRFVVTLTASHNYITPTCGVMVIGFAVYLGETEWDVSTRILGFSRKERNTDYGTVTFVKRGSAKGVQAVAYLDPAVMPGDIVQRQLQYFDGIPVFFNFNNSGSNYDRLQVFGFWTKVETVIKTATMESLLIDIEGLVD